jgi:hypothetical protein
VQRAGWCHRHVHGHVVRLGRHGLEHLVVEDEADAQRPRSRERTVIGTAALTEPVASGVDGESGYDDCVRVCDRVDAEPITRGLAQPVRTIDVDAVVVGPVELAVDAEDGQQDAYATGPQVLEHNGCWWFVRDRDIRSDETCRCVRRVGDELVDERLAGGLPRGQRSQPANSPHVSAQHDLVSGGPGSDAHGD